MFEGFPRNDAMTSSRIVLAIKDLSGENKDDCLDFIMNLVYFDNSPIGFFGGPVVGGVCGVGIVLKLSSHHFFRAQLATGVGSNIKVELLSLWGLLSFAKRCHIVDLMVAGDSKVVLDWFDGKSHLNALILRPWKMKIMALKQHFSWLKCLHVHRQYNSLEDSLSKLAQELQHGWLQFKEIFKDTLVNNGQFYIF